MDDENSFDANGETSSLSQCRWKTPTLMVIIHTWGELEFSSCNRIISNTESNFFLLLHKISEHLFRWNYSLIVLTGVRKNRHKNICESLGRLYVHGQTSRHSELLKWKNLSQGQQLTFRFFSFYFIILVLDEKLRTHSLCRFMFLLILTRALTCQITGWEQ